MELEDILFRIQSNVRKEQREAERYLNTMKQNDPSSFLSQLVDILADDGSRSTARTLAGLIIKNLILETFSVKNLQQNSSNFY